VSAPSPAATAPFSRPADRRNALDRAHLGEIEGALGTVRAIDTGPRNSARRKLLTLLAVLGPGVVVMVADNDAGTISVFSQAGQDHGLSILWILLLLGPALYVTQEMVARLGAVTGAGHARLTLERFGPRWCAFSLGDLLILNLVTLITEFIGVTFALGYFGISRYVSVPLAAATLIAVSAGGSFRRWERAMYVMIALDVTLIPLALTSHGHQQAHTAAALLPVRPAGGMILLLVALVGTTLAPWQLFFQQSSVVDKRITPRWLGYERVDTALGAVLFVLCAGAVLTLSASVLHGSPLRGHYTDIGTVLSAVGRHLGPAAGAVLALAVLNASLLAVGAVSLSGSYALGEVLGVKHSLHRRFSDARIFHGSYAAIVALSAGIVLIPGLPLGALTLLVQALTGILLPSALVLLLLLCNDAELLGPMRNGPVLNAIAASAIGVILGLSTLLTVTLTLPRLPLKAALLITAGIMAACWLPVGLAVLGRARRRSGRRTVPSRLTPWERRTWSSPTLELVGPVTATRPRVITLAVIRVYVVVITLLLLLKLLGVSPH
jgi:Mn2+/Fe2+ NRAMP family transporter